MVADCLRQIQLAVLTVLLLHFTITGAARFDSPEHQESDVDLPNHFHHRRRALLDSAASSVNKESKDDGAAADDDDDDPPPRDPSQPYSLGPKISDWDSQRSDWLRRHPEKPNFHTPEKPRVMLVTGSSPKPCENTVGDHFLLKSIKNKIDYGRIHNIDIFYSMGIFDPEMTSFWAKLPLVRTLMLNHPEVEFFWWMDSDAMLTDMAFEVPWSRYKNHNLIMHGWDEMVYDQHNWIGLNMGVFIMRNCQWSLDIMDAWAPMGPTSVREESGRVLSAFLKNRPVFEADDQSGMVYLLIKEREKWANKVYLENGFYLHGYWAILVDRYEEMMEKNRPGHGDDRWPLCTHFVGCKPCGKFGGNPGDYSVERCLKQMARAFNFGDNQILKSYGFEHKSLASRKVRRIRNETSDPLGAKDEFGLLHPTYKSVHAKVKA